VRSSAPAAGSEAASAPGSRGLPAVEPVGLIEMPMPPPLRQLCLGVNVTSLRIAAPCAPRVTAGCPRSAPGTGSGFCPVAAPWEDVPGCGAVLRGRGKPPVAWQGQTGSWPLSGARGWAAEPGEGTSASCWLRGGGHPPGIALTWLGAGSLPATELVCLPGGREGSAWAPRGCQPGLAPLLLQLWSWGLLLGEDLGRAALTFLTLGRRRARAALLCCSLSPRQVLGMVLPELLARLLHPWHVFWLESLPSSLFHWHPPSTVPHLAGGLV